jgi:hypothetical protein
MNTAIISTTGNASTVVITGVTGKRIRVLAYTMNSSTTAETQWFSATTAISGKMHMGANGNIAIHLGHNWPSGGLPVLQTNSGEDLILTTTNTAGIIGGHLTYVMVAV